MSPNRTRYLSYLCLYHHHLAEFLAQGGHSLSWLIKNTIRNYFIKKISSLMGMISSTSNVIINIFLYLGIFLTMSRWNGLHSSEESITWFFFIWRLLWISLSQKKGFFLGSKSVRGEKIFSPVIDKIMEGTLWALGSKPTLSCLLMLENYALIFIFILFPVPVLLGQYVNLKTSCIYLHVVQILDSIEAELKLNRVFYPSTSLVWF